MKSRILRKLLIILIIMALTATDFLMLGNGLVSYAADLNSTTNNKNIDFSVYFKNSKGEKVDKITEDINSNDLKIYAEIAVKEEGYFNGSIELGESNFNFKNESIPSGVTKIEGNIVTLNQINAGSTVEVELPIQPIISEKISLETLNMDSKIKLTGTYMENSYKGIDIKAEKKIALDLGVDVENTKSELDSEIITNKIYSIDGTNKRVVQLLIKSKLTDNNYPVQQTVIKTDMLKLSDKLPEEVKVLSLGTEATNGKNEDITTDSWKKDDNNIEITIKNEADKNKEISWKKDAIDGFIITFIYSEDVDASKIEIKTNSEISIYNYNGSFTAEKTVGIENEELNNVIVSEINSETKELYKGQLYLNTKIEDKEEISFNTITKIDVRATGIADAIKVTEQRDMFVLGETTIDANTRYVSSSINKDEMLKLLGEDGFVEIKVGDTTIKLTKDSNTDESGNIVVDYDTEIHELEITTSKPEVAGELKINHTKVIMGNTYTLEQMKQVEALKIVNTVTAISNEVEVVKNTAEQTLELKDTTSKVDLTVNKQNLSTMAENKEVMIGVQLETSNTSCELYKNPKISVKLPDAVEKLDVKNIDILYADEFQVKKTGYNAGNKTIEIELAGEQLEYAESEATQTYIQINANMTLDKMAPNKTDKISMLVANENAENKTSTVLEEKEVKISSPTGLVAMNDINTYDIETIAGVSEDKQLANIDKKTAGGSEVQFHIALVNNTGNTMNNIKILGNLPTDGKITKGSESITNTFPTTLKSAISAQNCTIYYSEKIDATSDLTDTNNGWNTDLNAVSNPKAYLIEIASMAAETNFEATYTVKLPATLEYDYTSYTGYQVLYNEGESTAIQKAESSLVGITTGEGIKLETTVEALVGNDTLKDGDIVKSGEVIKYRVKTTNKGTQTIENISVKAGVPTGTVVVVPEADYVYSGSSYYEEKTDMTEVTDTIAKLESGQTYITEYEVRVKADTVSGTQIINKANITCGEFEFTSNELKLTSAIADVRVTVKRTVDEAAKLSPGSQMEYLIIVENLSDNELTNLTLQLALDGQTLDRLTDAGHINVTVSNENKFSIEKIEAKSVVYFKLYTNISLDDVSEAIITVNVADANGNTYRSNKNVQTVEKIDATIKLNSPTDGEYVSTGNIIQYDFFVANTGSIAETIVIEDDISEYLTIEEILVDGDVKVQTTNISDEKTFANKISNNFRHYVPLESGKSAKVSIITRVNEISEAFENKTIINSAKVLVNEIEKDKSAEVSHIIKGNVTSENKNLVTGLAWLDTNQNGQRESDEQLLEGIKVMLYDVSTNTIAKNKDGNNAETTTNSKGEYTFTRINEGKYLVVFEFDTTKYELTTYMAEGVQESANSNVILKNLNINGQEKAYAVTDTINLTESISNINIGLKQNLKYDLELNKYISRIVVQNSDGTKAYEYNDSTFQKVEIHRKKIKGSVVILEYTIRVKNNGDIAGTVTSIKDYLPSGLEFSSELNADWYLSGEDLYCKSLANAKIEPGESKEIKLILTKTMTETNTGLINNRAEIESSYNEYGKSDIDSIENNAANGEDDLGAADVIISISTGGKTIAYTILMLANTCLIVAAVYLIFIKNRNKR